MYGNARQQQRYNFTKTFIDGLPANPHKAKSREKEYADQQVIGLRILVSKNGRKFWHVRFRLNSRKRILKIGEFPACSVQEARQRANEMKNLISKGIDPRIERSKKNNPHKIFKKFVTEDYIPFAKENKKSWRDDLSKFNKYLFSEFGHLPFSEIGEQKIQGYIGKIKKLTSASTSNKHLVLIKRLFNLHNRWNKTLFVQAKNVRPYKLAGGLERFLTDEELKRFLKELETAEQSVSVFVIKFLLYTGLRLSEATHLLWENVNFEASRILLPNTKSGKARNVEINTFAKDVLLKMKEFKTNEFVFPGKGPKGHILTPRRAFCNVRDRANLKAFRIHDLRHNFASHAVQNGTSLYIVQQLLGHSDPKITSKYSHLRRVDLENASQAVADSIGAAAN